MSLRRDSPSADPRNKEARRKAQELGYARVEVDLDQHIWSD